MRKSDKHRACTKAKHKSKTGAIIHAKKLGHIDVRPYRCPKCKSWHIGTWQSYKGARVIQILDSLKLS